MNHEQREMSETREPVNADMEQTFPRLAGDITSGRENGHTCAGNSGAQRQNFLHKIKTSHAAAGASSFHRVKRPF
jgi:hypothetical protein